jgi:sugar phosphate isomerase/epimerase
MTDLVLATYSLPRGVDFAERVTAAAAGGFASIGLSTGEYAAALAAGRSTDEMRALLDDHGLHVSEIEALRGWSAPHEPAYVELERLVVEIATELGPAHHVQVLGPFTGDLDEGAEAFAALCERLADHGLLAAIEFLPEMTNIPDAGVAMELVRRAGHPAGGLCVDVWHHERGAADPALLRAIPAERVHAVQLDDGPRSRVDADYYTDCTQHRRVPGEGGFDLVGFVRLLDDLGVDQPVSVEVLSAELQRLPSTEAVVRMAEGTRRVLQRARRAA